MRKPDQREPLIDLRDLKKSFRVGERELIAVNSINLAIYEHQYISIVGTSGSGKSTLLSILGLLETFEAGKYFLAGADVTNLTFNDRARVRNEFIGFVFQSFNLLGNRTVADNVLLPLRYSKHIDRSEWEERVKAALQAVKLSDKIDSYPFQLSGGQQQRVAIARAIVADPSVVLADEPTGNLDSSTSGEIMAIFDDLASRGATLVIVTHDQTLAARAHTTISISDGRVVHA